MTATDTHAIPRPATTVQQRRHLVTPVPGPRSRALMARKTSAVAAGVGSTLPVFAARAERRHHGGRRRQPR